MFPIFAGNSASTGYNLTRSLRFRASASATLGRTFASGNRKTWTLSFWVKRGSLGSNQNILVSGPANTTDATFANIGFSSSDTFTFTAYSVAWRTTTQVFRDPSAWYHIVVAWDTTQATASNRVKIYVNGTQVTAFSSTFDPSLNFDGAVNQAAATYISLAHLSYGCFDGYLAETYFIDGQALTPTSFGSYSSTTGVWQPARYSGTYGTNGAYLPFTDNSALTTSSNVGLGKDFSGNGNYWVTTNISITAGVTYDSMTDVPTLTSATAANFAVLNRLSTTAGTYSNANLRYVGTSSWRRTNSTIAVNSGKWYWEVTLGNAPFSPRASNTAYNSFGFGIATTFDSTTAATLTTDVISLSDNGYYKNFSGASTDSGVGFASSDVLSIAVDLTANTFTFYRNNSSLVTGTIGVTAGTTLTPVVLSYDGTYGVMDANFGQRPFAYTPPTGFVALNTFNLPTSTILKGNTVMDATIWTGNGGVQTITNAAGFKPDLVWMKSRGATYVSNNNNLFDSVRGANIALFSDLTNSEITYTNRMNSFNSNGFTTDSGYNANNGTFVGWQWQAGQGSTSSNTNGTITSTVSVNASAGFSVVTYTGTALAGTIGHGLGVAPQLIIVKPRSATITTDAWNVYHVSIGNTQFLELNTTNAATTATNRWNSTSPTSSVFSIGTVPSSVAVGYVAYCWTPIAGYSAFGSYTGNGSANGPFVYTGFRPKYLMIKRTDNVGSWWTIDTSRSPYNVAVQYLFADSSAAEGSDNAIDILSNGFKLRVATFQPNTSGGTFIYMAFAENPFKNALAR